MCSILFNLSMQMVSPFSNHNQHSLSKLTETKERRRLN